MIYYPLVFTLGLLVGSFLNVIIYRLHNGESIAKTRSHCAKCGHVLAWYELVPVVSFVIQRGRCRECGQRISLQYPLVELATGIVFVLIAKSQIPMFNQIPNLNDQLIAFLYLLVISCLLIVIFVYDLKHYLIPDKIIYPAIGIAFLYNFFVFLKLNHWDLFENWKLSLDFARDPEFVEGEIGNLGTLYEPLASAFIGALFFAVIFVLSRGRWLGFGDVKLAFLMGLVLGWPNILVALFVAFILGGIIGVALIAARKKTMKSEVPFGPFLVMGTFVAMFLGNEIAEWYWNLFI